MTPKTTEWAFINIDRANDYTVSSNRYFRDNWIVTRKRISNEPYISQLGEKIDSISGFNGGVSETIVAPTISGLSFTTTRNWIDSSWIFLETQYVAGNFPIYLPFPQPSVGLPEPAMVSVLLRGGGGGVATRWNVYQETRKNVEEGIFDDLLDGVPKARPSTNATNLNNLAFTEQFLGFSGNSTSVFGNFPQQLQCVSDSQRYIEEGVDWYTQEQTWRVLSSWRIEDV